MKGIIILNPFLVPDESVHQAERLKSEFSNLGVQTEIVSDAFLHTELSGGRLNVDLSGVDFVIYLDKDKYQSEILKKLSVRLFNNHDAIRLCDDKAETYLALIGAGVNIPKTIFGALCYGKDLQIKKDWAKRIGEKLGYPVIIKESFGSMGKGVFKADDEQALLDIMEKVKQKPHIFQEYVGAVKGVDVRVIVISGKALCAMERVNSDDFRSNVARGGKGVAITLKDSFKETAERCAKALKLDYCGVDLLYGNDGEPVVCEVNSNAYFDGIEKATGVNVAKAYAEYVIDKIKSF